MYRKNEHKYLHLGFTPQEKRIWICTLRDTAEHFGWADLPIYKPEPLPSAGALGWAHPKACPPRFSSRIGGTRIRICRAKSRHGNPRRMTHSLRISGHVTNRDLAELAFHAKPDWHWMENRRGIRRTRDEWLDLYYAQANN